jgi:hypothetical protein
MLLVLREAQAGTDEAMLLEEIPGPPPPLVCLRSSVYVFQLVGIICVRTDGRFRDGEA